MKRVESLLFDVVKDNMDDTLQGFFIDGDKGVAIAGHRRIYNTGDLLVRALGDFEVPDRVRQETGTAFYSYREKVISLDEKGIPGQQVEGGRIIVDAEEADIIFEEAYKAIGEGFMVLLNPKIICSFIESYTQYQGFQNKKINMQVFNGISNVGHFTGQIHTHQETGEIGLLVGERIFCHIDAKNSLLNPQILREDAFVVAEILGVVEGKRIVRILRPFETGVRFAIQDFRNGLMLDDAAPYSVHEERNNGITKQGIMNMPFLEYQFDADDPNSPNMFLDAPMLHFDLDSLYRALKPMEMHSVVEMIFKDSISPSIIRTATKEDIELEAVIGTTSPYRRGKVWTP
jgi:hypothetical protein